MEGAEKPVIAIYDVRGIQDYIFRTNSLKEIIGASLIVKNLVKSEFETAVLNQNFNKTEIILDWENAENLELKFYNDNQIKVEVLYYGGGNLVVLFRNEKICRDVSTAMSKDVIKKAYGLSLAYAYIEVTGDYQNDWKNLKDKLATVKATTPLTKPAGVLPIVQYDRITGFPLSKIVKEQERTKKVTFEAYQKLKKYENDQNEEKYMKQFDKMRTAKDEGLIAIVHIDGNSMGMNIGEIMRNAPNYEQATKAMREISKNIHQVFEKDAVEGVIKKIPEICKNHKVENLIKDGELPFRLIIGAGDDITFVCNERISLDIVKEYIYEIRSKYMYNNKYQFSACAGIAIVHSHFPFYKAYKIAEDCCQSAKKRAKNEGMINGKIGNFVDFQYCYSSNIGSLDDLREKNYKNIEGKNLITRPYGIYENEEELTDEQRKFSLSNFEDNLNAVSSIARNTAKELRDYSYKSEASLRTIFKRLIKKRSFKPKENAGIDEYYDALEFLDIFAVNKKEVNNSEKKL